MTKVITSLEKNALSDDHYADTMALLSDIERYLMDISFGLSCDIDFGSINVTSLIKSMGVSFKDDYSSLGEKIIDYMQLVTEFDRRKLFVIYGLRDFITNQEAYVFLIPYYYMIMI